MVVVLVRVRSARNKAPKGATTAALHLNILLASVVILGILSSIYDARLVLFFPATGESGVIVVFCVISNKNLPHNTSSADAIKTQRPLLF
jgi:heme A synthase